MTSFSQSSLEMGSDFVIDFRCTPCNDKKIVVCAEFYCKKCCKCYCQKCIYHHDQLFIKHAKYGRGKMEKWPNSNDVKDFHRKCEVHKDEKLDMFCNDHSQRCCPKCAFLHHRYCPNVTIISGAAKQQSTMPVLGNPDQVFTVKGMLQYDVSIPSDLIRGGKWCRRCCFGPCKANESITDSSICWIISICVLPDGQILVIDRRNKKLKLLDQQYRVLTHCDVSGYPRDICHITHNEVAVTVNDDNTHEIQFISVNNGQLVKGRKLQLRHYCEGIAHHQGELYVTDRTALYKYTLSGKLVSKLYKDTSDKRTVWKCAVSPTGDRIYITNWEQHKLLTLARNGSVLSTLEDPELQHPTSVHVTPAGQVLVCGSLSHAIIQVDREGRKKLATLATRRDGVGDPYSVCYNRHTASIIVGQDDNNILVFKVQ